MKASSSDQHVLASAITLTSVVILTSLATFWLTEAYHTKRDRERGVASSRKSTTKKSAASESSSSQGQESAEHVIPAEIREEQLSRHTLYFGANGMQALQQSKVCVVGLGGVGSHTVHMLARAGVGTLRLIDFDQVSVSSLNRHACATLADVGIPKVTCMARFCRKICPDPTYLKLETRVAMFTSETGPALLEGETWDCVVDAIDDIPTKAALLAQCLARKIPVLSCMGAGGKADPSRLHISDLQAAVKDPLATRLRQALKRLLPPQEHQSFFDMDALCVLYNSEKTVEKLAALTPEQKLQGANKYGAVEGMRVRIMPVLGTTPAIMGQALAAVVITRLGRKPIQNPVAGERVGKNVRNRVWQHLYGREDKITKRVLEQVGLAKMPCDNDMHQTGNGWWIDTRTGAASRNPPPSAPEDDDAIQNHSIWIGPVQIDQEDIDYCLQAWRNRCAVTGARLGTVLLLVRWDLSKPSTWDNLVLMSVPALERYDSIGNQWEGMPAETRMSIEKTLQSIPSPDLFH